jgi:hypothetical protein
MPYGRGWLGWGSGMGRGLGRGNSYPFCRFYPWLPRRWWAMPYASQYAANIPYHSGYSYPSYGMGYLPPYGHTSYGIAYPGIATPLGCMTPR